MNQRHPLFPATIPVILVSLTLWAGDNGHWKILDGVIDYDALSEAEGAKSLWTEKEYGNFTLRADWRIKETPYKNSRVPIVLPDGSHKRDAEGNVIQTIVPDSDSGIYLRGSTRAQVNIWCWPTRTSASGTHSRSP